MTNKLVQKETDKLRANILVHVEKYYSEHERLHNRDLTRKIFNTILNHYDRNKVDWIGAWFTGKVGMQDEFTSGDDSEALSLGDFEMWDRLLRITKYANKFSEYGKHSWREDTMYNKMHRLVYEAATLPKIANTYSDCALLDHTEEVVATIAKEVPMPPVYIVSTVIKLMNKYNKYDCWGYETVEEYFVASYKELQDKVNTVNQINEQYIAELPELQCTSYSTVDTLKQQIKSLGITIKDESWLALMGKTVANTDTWLHGSPVAADEENNYQQRLEDKELGIVKMSSI